MNCKNGFGFAHNGVCVIRGENAAGKKEAAASDPRLQVTANRPPTPRLHRARHEFTRKDLFEQKLTKKTKSWYVPWLASFPFVKEFPKFMDR
ncbi:MAG: hypothetical protein DMF10_09885 [Verrucomicrobia bacterium]|nr:MAG: hypothetical protein DMF10_09885 [Verrucomicrobiota bacterium]